MPSYVVMFPADDEAAWEAGSEADRQATYDVDGEFVARLEAAGGRVTGGAAVVHSRQARTLRRGPAGEAVVTEAAATQAAGQLSGFFLVDCDAYDALVDAAGVLVGAHPVVEIRPVDEDG